MEMVLRVIPVRHGMRRRLSRPGGRLCASWALGKQVEEASGGSLDTELCELMAVLARVHI
jgi:hypothetical protein